MANSENLFAFRFSKNSVQYIEATIKKVYVCLGMIAAK